MSGGPQSQPADNRPVPDPTALTTQALLREVDLLAKQITAEFAIRDQRIDGMDKAMELFQNSITRVPTDVDKQVATLHDLCWARFDQVSESFSSIKELLREIDKRAEQANTAAKDAVSTAFVGSEKAVAAALAAQKEAVASQNEAFSQANTKAENATGRLLDGLSTQITQLDKSLNEKVDDVRTRMTSYESRAIGKVDGQDRQQTQQDNTAKFAFAVLAALGTLFGIGMAIVALMK